MLARWAQCAAVLAVVVAASPAHAQPADVAAQIKLIDSQPADMDRSTWKDKRRDAARKLGQSKDKRAVPVLIKLAETETFDIIGEIAIEGLGNLGDPAAVPVLQKIAGDASRDKAQRDLAKKALAKLGAEGSGGKPGGSASSAAASSGAAGTGGAGVTAAGGAPTGGTPGAGRASGAGTSAQKDTGAASQRAREPALGEPGARLLGGASASELPELPDLPDDTLAAYERVTFAGGTANLGYDSTRKRVDFDADVAGQYQKRVEREAMAWGWDAGAHVVAGYVNPEGAALTRGLQIDATANADARFYSGKLYGIGRAAAATQVNYVSDVDANNPGNTLKDTRFTADLQIALGGGYGRVLDVGAAIRVRRLVRTLDAARALGRPIDAATTRRLELTWWALRGERSTYRALVTTVAILREAGILLGEPDAGLSYEILNVLRDSQLYLRPSGFDVQLLFGEGYLQRPDDPTPTEQGRVEQVLAHVDYGAQLDDDKLELSGGGYGRVRLFAGDNEPSPWAVGATARVRRFTYGDHGDPFGALDLSGTVQLSDDDLMNSQVGQRVTGQLGFTWWLNPASGFRLAASVGEDRGALFLGAQLEATYGLLDGTFAR
ncbi:MAG TPA: HEAT repeat domain-containing protein [Kofleriaceae bacterium]|nr:HEAT repeat domain-containing protein [Kofleriaceae bacterium]